MRQAARNADRAAGRAPEFDLDANLRALFAARIVGTLSIPSRYAGENRA